MKIRSTLLGIAMGAATLGVAVAPAPASATPHPSCIPPVPGESLQETNARCPKPVAAKCRPDAAGQPTGVKCLVPKPGTRF